MAFISVAEELTKKSITSIENKFILKYLPEIEPFAIKVYLYALYLYQNGQSAHTLADLSAKLKITEDEAQEWFTYLESYELVAVTSVTPFEVKILDCDNYFGKPKVLHPEKYEGLYEEIQSVFGDGRMVSQDEFREYLIFLEEYGFERNALVMVIAYCIDRKGNDIGAAYIKKVLKNFESEGTVTEARVKDKLATYTASTASVIKIFSACGIKRKPETQDNEFYGKWIDLGFNDDAIIAAVKSYKIKSFDKLNTAILELYKNKKFDAKEIADYRKTKDSLYVIAVNIAKSLGVYISDPTPYVENYLSVWSGYGFSGEALLKIANYCFLSGKNSFDGMNDFVSNLYKQAFVDDDSVNSLLSELAEDDKFIKSVLAACGLTRKIIPYDRQALTRWRDWGFNEAMMLKAAELSASKNNPVAAMNYLLSTWKNGGVYTVEQIPENSNLTKTTAKAAQRQRDFDVLKSLYDSDED